MQGTKKPLIRHVDGRIRPAEALIFQRFMFELEGN